MKKLTGEIMEFADSIVIALVAVMVVFTLFFSYLCCDRGFDAKHIG